MRPAPLRPASTRPRPPSRSPGADGRHLSSPPPVSVPASPRDEQQLGGLTPGFLRVAGLHGAASRHTPPVRPGRSGSGAPYVCGPSVHRVGRGGVPGPARVPWLNERISREGDRTAQRPRTRGGGTGETREGVGGSRENRRRALGHSPAGQTCLHPCPGDHRALAPPL